MQYSTTKGVRDGRAPAHALCVVASDDLASRLALSADLAGLKVDRALNLSDALVLADARSYTIVIIEPAFQHSAQLQQLQEQLPISTYIVLGDERAQEAASTPKTTTLWLSPEAGAFEAAETLGRAQLLAEERHLSSTSLHPVSSSRKDEAQLLLLEDNERDARFIVERLRDAKFEGVAVARATTLQQAIDLLAQGQFALVLADLTLPDALGLDAVVALRRAAAETPLVVLADLGDDVVALQAVRLGAQDILVKSELSADTLRRTVRAAVERNALQGQLERRTRIDSLTGLLNRAAFVEAVEKGVDRARATASMTAVMFIDLNGFKQINDTLGHEAGDEVLKCVTERLRGCARDTDAVARLGGDEFAVLCEQLRSASDAMAIASRMSEAVREAVSIGERSLTVGASIGLAFYPDDGESADALIRRADEAMYRAKRGARESVVCYGDPTSDTVMTLQRYEQELKQLVLRKDFRLSRHWILALSNGATLGWLLVPTFQVAGTSVEPATIFRLLESTGLVEPTSREILATACQLEERMSEPLLVRVTSLLLRDPEVYGRLRTDLSSPMGTQRRIELVIGQEEVCTDSARGSVVGALKGGIPIWLGDYGRRNVDLKLLSRLPGLRGVILDVDWCRELYPDETGFLLLRAFTSALEPLNMRVIAPACEIPVSWFLAARCHAVVSSVALQVLG